MTLSWNKHTQPKHTYVPILKAKIVTGFPGTGIGVSTLTKITPFMSALSVGLTDRGWQGVVAGFVW